MTEKKIGIVFDYFSIPSVAAIEITDGILKTGEKIHILGHTTDFTQVASSMQVDHGKVEEAKKGDKIGLKVEDRVRPHDIIYKIEDIEE